ncbi:MAG: hypothetical protein LBL39_04900 [Planctomycetaceae bacterium]|nr:hypothetical protein [Planctomycetaceae bacterium]
MKSKIVIGLGVLVSFVVCVIIIYAQANNNAYQPLPQNTQNVDAECCTDSCCSGKHETK